MHSVVSAVVLVFARELTCIAETYFAACAFLTFSFCVFFFFFFCRGFGFVTFTDAASVDKVLAQQHHELDSKTVS